MAKSAILLIHTILLGLDFLFLFLVVTFFGVLIENGAVISLYAEASNPSFCGTASGMLVTSVCYERASSFS